MDSNGAEQSKLDAIIIGCGMSGICAAYQLQKAGYKNLAILEKSGGIGGTWNDNIYPGSGCDVPSHLYSYSFKLNPDWSRVFSRQSEIKAYFENCVEEFGLKEKIHFNTEVVAATFNEETAQWQIYSKDGQSWSAPIMVMGVGQLNLPKIPDIRGLDAFKGPSFHSARWDYDVDLKGKKVAVIGTGASAVQFIPEVAKDAAHIDLYQRSPNWMIARGDKAYKPWLKWVFRHISPIMRAYRMWIYWKLEARFAGFHKEAWIGHILKRESMKHLKAEIHNPELRKQLTPDFPVGCKRILISDDYYEALCKDNIDIVSQPIDHIEENSIITNDGKRHEADLLIFGTGFQATGFLSPIKITGRKGRDLHQSWTQGAEAYRGTTVAGFPNMFVLYGPNTNLGHNSIIFMVERQVEYMMKLLTHAKKKQARWVDVKADVMDRYNAEMQEQLKQSVWDADCGNWYKTSSGKITNNWPSWTVAYWWTMRQPNYSDFEYGN